jgi:AcrR family transcriptional regulator
MHYYFHTREQIYDCLIAEAYSIVADCIAQAKRQGNLLAQLTTFATAAHRLGFADESMLRFVITARLESHRSPSLRENRGPVVSAVQDFYTSVVDDAVVRGEIPADTDARSVVSMLLAMFLGMGFYAGFIVERNDMAVIAKQLHRVLTRGLLNRQHNGHALAAAPPLPVTVGAEAGSQTWRGLTG